MTQTDIDQAALVTEYDAALRKSRKLSLGYGLGTGLCMAAALWLDTPWAALPVWLTFVAWLWVRYRGLRRRRDLAADTTG